MAFKSNMLFDVLANILVSKSISIYNEHIASANFKDAAKFMILRYCSMHTRPEVRNLVLDNYLVLERMPEKTLYKWLIDNVPRQKSAFIQYLR